MDLWYGRIALDNGWIMPWWYLPRIWPSVTDMQHYYHARYPTDDWHLAYMFLLVCFSVEVCLEGVVPHSVSTRRDPCVKVYASLTLALPLARKQNRTRVTRLSTCTKRGGVWTTGLTHAKLVSLTSPCCSGWLAPMNTLKANNGQHSSDGCADFNAWLESDLVLIINFNSTHK